MKKIYKRPTVRMIDYSYDEQVKAESMPVYCDQGWTRMTTLKPAMRTAFCDRCDDDLIWINQLDPWAQ